MKYTQVEDAGLFDPFMWSKSLDWFLYDNGLRHERVKYAWPFAVYKDLNG